MKDIILLFLFGITLFLFAGLSTLYITEKKFGDLVSRILTSAGGFFLLIFSLVLVLGKAGGYDVRFASFLPDPFNLTFHVNRVDWVYILVCSVLIILTSLLPLLSDKRTVDTGDNFFRNLIYIAFLSLVTAKNLFILLFMLESGLLLLFLFLNRNFSDIRTARRSIFYFFITQMAFFIASSGFYLFQSESGFSEITVYSVPSMPQGSLNISYILIASGFIMLILFYNSIIKSYLNNTNISRDFVFISLTMAIPTLLFVFIKTWAPLMLKADEILLYITTLLAIAPAVYGTIKTIRNKGENINFFVLTNQAVVILSSVSSALIGVKQFDSIRYISLTGTMIIIISSVILTATINIINEYFQNNKSGNIIKISAMSIYTLAIAAAYLPNLLQAGSKAPLPFFASLAAGILSIAFTVTNFVFWIKIIVSNTEGIEFEDIKEDTL